MNNNDQPNAIQLPNWIPWQGKHVYSTIIDNGGYADQRHATAFETLFQCNSLREVWESLSKLRLSLDGWSFLLGGLILAVECAPANGKRATRNTKADEKIQILERQKQVDKLLGSISAKANELVGLLDELQENGGTVPAETYCGLALIERSIENDGMASATCAKPFNEFCKKLSSYDKRHFPKPREIISKLADAAQNHPNSRDIFADDPWLSSGQSSWKDYVRVLMRNFEDCREIYGDAPSLSDAHWCALVKAMIDKSIYIQVVAKGLKEL